MARLGALAPDRLRIFDAALAKHAPLRKVAESSASCPDAHEANTQLAARLSSSVDLGAMGTRPLRPSASSLVRRLRVSSSPYVVLQHYVNRSVALAMRAEVVAAIGECSEAGEGHDRRRLGAPVTYPLMRAFERDPYLLDVARHHLGATVARLDSGPTHHGHASELAGAHGVTANRSAHTSTSKASIVTKGRTLMTPVVAKPINVKAQAGFTRAGENSGGGWHKDTLSRGIKALLYLDDVDATNGPFSMLLNYKDRALRWSRDAVSGIKRRLNESVVEEACRTGGSHVESLHASMGSVIIFEISSVHRGMPCQQRERVSVTNYYKVSKPNTTCSTGSQHAGSAFRGTLHG